MIEEIRLDGAEGALNLQDLNDSRYWVYQNKTGLWIGHVEVRVLVRQGPKWCPESFSVPITTPLGYDERFGWTNLKHWVEYSRT